MKLFRKNILRFGLVSFATLLFCVIAGAQTKYALSYNLKKGETYKININAVMTMTQTTSDANSMKISTEMLVSTSFHVKDFLNERYLIDVVYDNIKMNIGMPMGQFTIDSNTPDNVASMQNMGPLLKAAVGKPVKIEITPNGKVESLEGSEELMQAMLNAFDPNVPENARKELVKQFGAQFSGESLKQSLGQFSAYFPDKPVAVGDSWVNKINSTMGSGGVVGVDMNLTLKNVKNNVATIETTGDISSDVNYSFSGNDSKMSMKGTQKGFVSIDLTTGWIVDSNTVADTESEMNFGGSKIPMKIRVETKMKN